ncbi:MAG: molybdenum cofactor guanylyltransferase [Myxococcales bacterium]|nr:molybdenum cofactor guanylyltransferase [Myxococcales bacterium]
MKDAGGKLAASAAILAGGEARRFGSNKALADVDGRPIIAHVAEALAAAFEELLLIANVAEPYAFLGLKTSPDDRPGLGPLGGIATALRASRFPWTFVVACDMPAVDPSVASGIARLAIDGDADAVAPHVDGRWHPLFACYHRRLLPKIEERLDANRLSVHSLLDGIRVRRVDETEFTALGGTRHTLWNVNRPEDLDGSASRNID